MMEFVKAITDSYGLPKGHCVVINPNYIIKMEYMEECEDGYTNRFKEHYVITVDLGNKTEQMHISLETGQQLLKNGGIKL